MATINQFWDQLEARARWGLFVGAVLIVLLTAGVGYWALKKDHKVLFANLAPQDAATMVAELERMKVPYRLEDEGNTILVPADIVYNTRLKLVGRDLPLQGTVGLELFNNSDIGMTEFAQKVNYQRAQQGELTRTILSIDGVQSARVHLPMQEQGLFKKNSTPAKASISLTMKHGAGLKPDQVAGIQRLVAAAIANIKVEDVTVLDQHGVALTQSSDGEESDLPAGNTLDGKRGAEEYINRKLVALLDKTFGAGQAIASVDVVLNQDRAKTTTESVLPGTTGEAGNSPAGVVVRERQNTRSLGDGAASAQAASSEVTSNETEYQVGRRVEQVVHARGEIKRLNVAVVVKKALDAGQIERLKEMVTHAVGGNAARGDSIAVYSLNQFAEPAQANPAPAADDAAKADPAPAAPGLPSAAVTDWRSSGLALALFVVVLGVAATMVLRRNRGRRRDDGPRRLTEDERNLLLTRVRGWMDGQPAQQAEQKR